MTECKHTFTMHDDKVVRCFACGERAPDCPDCGKLFLSDSHTCLDLVTAHRYIRELRAMNAAKNEELENCSGCVLEAADRDHWKHMADRYREALEALCPCECEPGSTIRCSRCAALSI